ncbi:MAG: hypothetical protein ABIT01_05395 [Thermoanaerobaculia bacterium]
METLRIAFDHLFILAIGLFVYALMAGAMTTRHERDAPYGTLFLAVMAYAAWFQALYSNVADRFTSWDLAFLGVPIVIAIFVLPVAAAGLFARSRRGAFHWVALVLTLAYLPFFAVVAHQATGPGGVLAR